MSAIPSTNTYSPTTPASGTSPTGSTSSTQSLSANDFISFLLTELQNQDPLDPTSSNDMLQQMSEIGQLQSADTIQSSLTTMVGQNQMASAATMIGKPVTGTDANGNPLSGTVQGVSVSNGTVSLTLYNGSVMNLSNLTSIGTNSSSNSNSNSSS